MDTNNMILRTVHLSKSIKMGKMPLHILKDISLDIHKGEYTSIVGPSGSGKSTLLGLMGGLDNPTRGKVIINGEDITEYNEKKLTAIRSSHIGFVFQFFDLLPTLTALENVALPLQFSAKGQYDPLEKAEELLTEFGLKDRMKHLPGELSGGEQQRVAIARALSNDPALLLCDEPTGNLDSASGEKVLKTLIHAQETLHTTVIIVSHDKHVADIAHRTIELVDGRVTNDK